MSNFTGLSPNNPRVYVGPNVALNTVVTRNRSPTGADYRQPETGKLYPFNTFWLVAKNPTTGTQGDLWYLSKIEANVAYWVMLSGGNAPMLSVMVQAFSAPGVNPVEPDGNGLMTINGAAVANHSVPIETRTRGLNAFNVEVQYAGSSATTDATKAGITHFNNTQFTVDGNGFVTITGGVVNTITAGPGITITGTASNPVVNSVEYTNQAVSTAVTKNSGWFPTAAITLTLPASPAQGDLLEFACTTASALVIDPPSTHLIRIGTLVTSSGGTVTSTAVGDALKLRYRAVDTTWYAISCIGTWIIS